MNCPVCQLHYIRQESFYNMASRYEKYTCPNSHQWERTINRRQEPPHPVQIVNRFEVIDHRQNSDQFGRRLVIWTDEQFRITESRQDGGRTLKIFLD